MSKLRAISPSDQWTLRIGDLLEAAVRGRGGEPDGLPARIALGNGELQIGMGHDVLLRARPRRGR